MRPTTLSEFQGTSNSDIVERLKIAITSARIRQVSVPNILLCGGSGCGKSTLANIIANEINAKCIVRTGGSISKQSDLFTVMYEIDTLQKKGREVVLFFDEIHKLSVDGMPEEMFYALIEEFKFYSSLAGKKMLLNGEQVIITSNAIKTKRPFTIIGATIAPGLLQKPLRDRFTILCYLKPYSVEDLIKIVQFNTEKENIKINTDAMIEIAKRARGTPRVAINFLQSCRDRALYKHNAGIDVAIVKEEMKLQEIQEDGMTALDLKILKTLAKNPKGLGMRTLAGICDIDISTLEEMIFPFLATNEYVKTTSKRFITDLGLERLKKGGE